MFALRASRMLQPYGIHYGWVIVALTFLYALVASTAMTVPGILILPISQEFGWTIGDVSAAMALRLFLFGAIAPFAGALLVRYGLRRMMMSSAILLVLGLAMALAMTRKWELWVSVGILLGVAPGLTALVVNTTIASRWFVTRRGLVVGILSAAIASGQLLFLPVAAWLSQNWGWRAALSPTLAAVAICGIVYALFACNDPYELGLAPYGDDTASPRPAPVQAGNALALSFTSLRGAVSSPVFWVLAGSFFVCGLSSQGLMGPHFVPLCHDFGVTAVTAASLLAVMGMCDFVGTIGSGWLSDRFDCRWLLSWYYGLRGLSLIWLTFSDFSLAGLSVFAVFFGLDYIATVPPTVKIAVQAFGRAQAPVVMGWIFASHQLGGAIMAAAAGITRDELASYLPSFFGAGIACGIAAVSMLVLLGRRNPARAVAS